MHLPTMSSAPGRSPFVPPHQGHRKRRARPVCYTHPDEVKGKKIIIGGGAYRLRAGYFFASEWGAQVDILEMRDDVCDSGMSQRMALLPRMKKSGMGTHCPSRCRKSPIRASSSPDKRRQRAVHRGRSGAPLLRQPPNDDIVKSLEG